MSGDIIISSSAEQIAIRNAIGRLQERLGKMATKVQQHVGTFQAPRSYAATLAAVQAFGQMRKRFIGNVPWSVPESLLPIIARALIDWRLERAGNFELQADKVTDQTVLQALKDELDVLNRLVESPWVNETTKADVPQVADILTLELAEAELRSGWAAKPRVYDEKFHLLQAPHLRWSDLTYFRQACGLRGRTVGVAFVDIDEFGAFNKALSEPVVDRLVLPHLMRIIEASVFGRGFAYRMGGDEYLLLLPNMATTELRQFLGTMRRDIQNANYAGVDKRTTVSIGYVSVDPHAALTDREAITRAALAKATAKDAGRNRVAGYEDGYCEPPGAPVNTRPAAGAAEALPLERPGDS